MAQNNLPMPADFGSYKMGNQMIALTPDLIKTTICPGLTDIEVMNFGFLCQQNNLNPFTRESYAVKYGSSPASLIIAKQGLANRAERNGHLKSKTGGIIQTRCVNQEKNIWETKDVKGSFVEPGWSVYGAWAIVTRDDRDEPYEERVLLSEYFNDKNPLWKSKQCTMLAKVAMQHALREAFPIENPAGVYYEEEFSDDLNPIKQKRVSAPASHNDFEEETSEPTESNQTVDQETGEIKFEE